MSTEHRGKIAFISVHGDPAINIGKEAGGQNIYVRKVGEALARRGWQVDMFTRCSDALQEKIVRHSPNCRTIRLTAGLQSFISRQKLFEYLPEFLDSFIQFQHDQKTIYPIVHTNCWLSAWVGMELKKRQLIQHLHTYHSLGAVKYGSINTVPMIAKTRLEIEKQCLETADMAIATSPQEKEHMRSLVSTEGNIQVIPCGTDISAFGSISQSAARAKISIAPEDKLVLYVGCFDRRQGIETLVRAIGTEVKHQPNLKLIIAGGSTPSKKDGEERERIESIVRELGLQDLTIFPDRLSDRDLIYYYAAADVCVVPSHYEPFGLVAIEAMASGTPVVASQVGGLKYTVVHEVTGLLAPPQEEQAFASAIDQILSNPSWCRQLGKNARERVESKFSWDGVASQLDRQYLSELDKLHQGFLTPAV